MTELMTAKQAHQKAEIGMQERSLCHTIKKIQAACERGEFSITISDDDCPRMTHIEEELIKLGYTVKSRKDRYVGSLKALISMRIEW